MSSMTLTELGLCVFNPICVLVGLVLAFQNLRAIRFIFIFHQTH